MTTLSTVAHRATQVRLPLYIEPLEARCLLDCSPETFLVRTYDGTCNNLEHPEWGSAGIGLLRQAPAAYADGISVPVIGHPPRPSPRVISNAVVAQEADIPERRFLSAMAYSWGQFIDHDLDLTTNASPPVPFNIEVPRCDSFFDPDCTGTQIIHLNRSKAVPGTGTDLGNPRQQPNEITAFIDGSMIYGSDAVTADALRTHTGGRLKTSPGNLLPFNNSNYFRDCAPGTPCLPMANDSHRVPDTDVFAAGDVRANENVELTSMHTLFLREHNRLAARFERQFPGLDDEGIYQLARHFVAAEFQVVTYREWIPAIFGRSALPPYRGYHADVNPGIANEFSTASFRVGHSMLGDDVLFLDNNGEEVREQIPLSEAFFNPPIVSETDIGPILKYLASDPSQEIDTQIVNSVRNFLFGPPGAGGFDLASLNMQRGRDHGLADYNTIRAAYHLPRVTSFAQITSNVELQNALRDLYGNVNNIDPWLGGLAEDHVPGTSTGQLIRRVVLDQFERIRDGDRFWYQRHFSGALLAELERTRLKDIIARNTPITNLQDNVFFFRLSISGTVFNDLNRNGRRDRGEPGLPDRVVRLINVDTGEEVARTTTAAGGRYTFNNLNTEELMFGTFRVREVVPAGWVQTSLNPADIRFTRGRDVAGVNFGTARLGAGADEDSGAAADDSVAALTADARAANAASFAPIQATPQGTHGGELVQDATAWQSPVAVADAGGLDHLVTDTTIASSNPAVWVEPVRAALWATDELFASL